MDFVLPDYDSGSIVNFSAAILDHFSAKKPAGSELYSLASNGMNMVGAEKVVIFIIDALGYHNLLNIMKTHTFGLFSRESVRMLTSVFPSTTTAALTSIFTATPPAVHGMLGYLLNIPEYGGLVNMIELTPYTQDRDALTRLGFDPLKHLEIPSIFEALREVGVRGYHLTSKSFVNTGLTRMHTRGGIARGAHGFGDLFEELNLILESEEDRSLTIVYWGLIDTYGHRYGPDSLSYSLETVSLIEALEGFFESRVNPNVAIFLTADHGQIKTPWEHELWWSKFDELFEGMYSMPGGEQRMAYIYTKDVRKSKTLLEETCGNTLEVLTIEEAENKNLFGGPLTPLFKKRVGELVTVSREDYSLCFKYTGQEHSLRGRHGGLSPFEMYVPLIFLRKD